MKHIIIISSALFFLGFAQAVSAETAAGTLTTAGRSIPENSIAVSSSVSGVVGQAFVLDATKSQDDGVVRTFTWKQLGGPIVPLSGTGTLKPAFTPSVAGTYVFELIATDATGIATVMQKSEFIISGDASGTKTPPPPPPPLPPGDPDFDLLRTAPTPSSPVSAGDVDRDGAVDVVSKTAPSPSPVSLPRVSGDTRAQTVLTDSNESRDKVADASGTPRAEAIVGDPDFDLLNISVGGDDLEKFRAEVAGGDASKKVTVRGWDPEKKEEIISRPEAVKTSEDLKVYVKAVALDDPAIEAITLGKESLSVKSKEEGKLFWFIPVEMSSLVTVEYKLSDSSEDHVSVKLPWWGVFVKKNYGASALEAELTTGVFDPAKWQKVDNSEAPVGASRISQVLSAVSNVLKTKHDTAKNSVANVR